MIKLLLRPFCSSVKPRIPTRLANKPSNTPRPPKDPPDEGYAPQAVNHSELDIPDFVRPEVYRQFSGQDEQLGPGAGKSKQYKAPHYYAYHRFSFVELQNQSMELRDDRRIDGGVQVVIASDDDDGYRDDSMEAMSEREEECNAMLLAQAKDAEKAKLKAWCATMEKKQVEMVKLQMSNNLGNEELKEWCEQMEKRQAMRSKMKMGQVPENMRQIEKEKIQETIDKKVTEILAECANKLTKAVEKSESKSKEQCKESDNKAFSECKDMVKKAAEKTVQQAKVNDDKLAKQKTEEQQKNDKPKGNEAEKCANKVEPVAKKPNEKDDKVAKPKQECAEAKRDDTKKPENH